MALLQPTQFEDGGSGTGSLRDLILQANSTPEDDIIELQGGEVYSLSIGGNTIDNPDGETIDLGNGNTTDAETITFSDENGALLGDLDISNNGTLTIRVVGEGQATIDASGIPEGDRVIDVQENANLTLENIVITGGNAAETRNGGGIAVRENAQTIINSVTVTGNSASGYGGGIISYGSLEVNNSKIENNTATDAGGGIVVAENSEINLNNSQVNNNTANQTVGGGIFIEGGGFARINESTIANNSSLGNVTGSGGGGIFSNGTAEITNSSITGNSSSEHGGGIHIVGGGSDAQPFIVSNSIISNNTSDSDGGGIRVDTDSTTQITNNIISNNLSNTSGGGVHFLNTQGSLVDNVIFNNSALQGGGIAFGTDSEVISVNNQVQNNTASNFGGGILVLGTSTLVNNNISGNSAENFGGGAGIAVGGQASYFNTTFTDNSASNSGGGIYSDGEVTLSNTIIANSESGNDFIGEAPILVGVNLVEDGSITGENVINADPDLSSIENTANGTFIHPLRSGSPAINTGNNNNISPDVLDLDRDGDVAESLPIDLLSNQRIVNDTVDLGALEFGASTVYRFFNTITGVHFYTANEIERAAVQELDDFEFEGISYQGADPLTGQAEPEIVYRFLNENTGAPFYTISETEREAVQELDSFSFEGGAFFAYETQVEGSIPVYRFFNENTGAHFYTPSAVERDSVENNLPDFRSEGIAYYAFPAEL